MPILRRAVRTWHVARRPLTRHRMPYVLLNRLRPSRRDLLVDADTPLLVEGPMRSGNTFAVAAIRSANDELPIARHMHAPAHVLHAVHLGVPTVVLIRDPRDACASHVIRRPALELRDSLQDWIDFYRTLRPVRDHVVVASFEAVTGDLGSVIDEVNRRFGTSFQPYEHSPENDAEVLRIVERMNRAEEPTGEVNERRVARPSPARDRRKEQLRRSLSVPPNAQLLSEAERILRDWRSIAVLGADQSPEDNTSSA